MIVTRFSPEDQKTHGHHTASAILAQETFSAAADPNRFPEQLAFVNRGKRRGWFGTRLRFSLRTATFHSIRQVLGPGTGGYNPLLGKAYTEIAAASISMHKSQGVGGPPRRGARKEYFKPLARSADDELGFFEGVDTSWSRVANSESVAAQIRQIISKFNPADPAASVPDLLKLRQTMSGIQDESWIAEKKAQLDKIIAACLGLHVEASRQRRKHLHLAKQQK